MIKLPLGYDKFWKGSSNRLEIRRQELIHQSYSG